MPDWRARPAVPAFTLFGGSRSIYQWRRSSSPLPDAAVRGPRPECRVPDRSRPPRSATRSRTDRRAANWKQQRCELEVSVVPAKWCIPASDRFGTASSGATRARDRSHGVSGAVTQCERPGHSLRTERSGSARHRVRDCERVGALVWRSSQEVRALGQQVRASGHDVQAVGAVVLAIESGRANDSLTHCKRSSQIPLGVRPWLVVRGTTDPMYERSIGAVHHRALIPLCGG